MSKDPVLWEVERAATLQMQGKTAEAVKAARRVLDHHGQHPAAIQAAVVWAKAEGDNPMAIYTLSKCYLLQGKFNEALQGFEITSRMDPKMAEAWAGLAICSNKQGDLLRAMDLSQKALAIDPKNINAHLCVLDTYYDMGEFEKGLAHALSAMETLPPSAGMNLSIGRFYKELDELDKAAAYFDKAIKLDPENPGHRSTRIMLALERRDEKMIFQELPEVVDLFEQKPHFKKMMSVIWTTLRSMYVLVEKKVFTDTGRIVRLRNLDDEDTHSEHLVPIDRSKPVQLFQGKDIRFFTTDFLLYDGENTWMNMRVTGIPFRFLMSCDITGHAYVEERFPATTLEERGILLTSADNYYHWIIDFLPRLGALDFFPELRDLPLYINENIKPYQLETLEMLGIGPDRIRKIPGNALATAKDVVIPYVPGRPMRDDNEVIRMKPNENPYILTWLREKFVSNTPIPEKRKRYFLSRKDTRFRRIINEDRLFEIAQKYGFEIMHNEGKSFKEQMEIYRAAEAFVGAHGASFTNMIFAPDDTKVFELFPIHRKPPFYESIARQTGQKYLSLDGPIVHTFDGMTPDFGDFKIDEERFEKIMAENFGQ